MSVRKISAKLAVAAVAATGLSVAVLAPAQAAIPNPTNGQEKYFDLANSGVLSTASIAAGSLIGVGSDTIQFVDGALSEAYNKSQSLTAGTSAGALVSLASCQAPVAGASTLTSCDASGIFPETFPRSGAHVTIAGSSGSGANALDGGAGSATTATALPDVAFARASGVKNSSTLDNLPFAVDQLVAVVSNKVTSNAPANITLNELAGIYSGIYTNWAQLGGKNAPIHAYYINDSSSGTYQFFGKQLEAEEGMSTSDSGKSAYHQYGTESASTAFVSNTDLSGKAIKEHDPSAIQNDPDAITAMSYSRIKLSAADNGGKAVIKPLGGYIADRAVYTIIRDFTKTPTAALANVPADWIANVPASAFDTGGAFAGSGETYAQYQTRNIGATLFGPTGYFCGSSAKPTIEEEGFFQLDSSVCGKAVSADPTLSATDMPALSKTSGTLAAAGTAGKTQVSAIVAAKTGAGTPTGAATFSFIPVNAPNPGAKAGGAVTATLAGGVATATIPATVPAGTYQVAVTYSGDSSFQASWTDYDVTSGSAPVPSTIVIGKAATTTPITTHPTTPVKTAAQKKLAKDKAALVKAKKQLKKAHGHKKTVLKKKIAKLNKAIKKDKKNVKAGK
ncbi:substrate-binding domain-containing protein [Nocardioides sp. Iso805N]|uniref:substrate-binding domain-containing protein n=1 Tax=Nocardioides sp. Iso805N TaxID=1283287 RepID=UPI0003647A28|nr:substrate-binding domain-containing protein [Nocardioides sp. Iso805N]